MAIVYTHMKLDNKEIYYIGIGNKESRAYHKGSRSDIWKRYYNKYGLIVDILCKDISIEEAKNIEKYLISFYGKKQLCNRTDGGEGFFGGKHSEETKLKISNFNKGKKASEETLLKMSLSSKGHNRRPKGTWKQNSEAKSKISKAFKGKKRSEYFCQQVKKSKQGYKLHKNTLDKSVEVRKEKAVLIREINSNFIGKVWDMEKEFNISRRAVYSNLKTNLPISKSTWKGLNFIKELTTTL
jgi:hypothetical protein